MDGTVAVEVLVMKTLASATDLSTIESRIALLLESLTKAEWMHWGSLHTDHHLRESDR